MVSGVSKVIKGSIKSRKLYADYALWFNQPIHSRKFWHGFQKYSSKGIIKSFNVIGPNMAFFLFVLPIVAFGVAYRYLRFGVLHQALQMNGQLDRKGNYTKQVINNTNPDNFWDNNNACWTSDPACGLDVGPKRPWESLKNPE